MSLSSHLTELVFLFNRQKTDLPPGTIHKDCVFRLNGRAYHETLGRPSNDPLVRLIGCGPAAYRLMLTAVRYAVTQARVTLHGDAVDRQNDRRDGDGIATAARAMLSGRLRGTDVPLRAECELTLRGDAGGHIREVAITMGDADVELILAARKR